MTKKFKNQEDVEDEMFALEAEATRLEALAGSNAPSRPAKAYIQVPPLKVFGFQTQVSDCFTDAENLESHIALLRVQTRLQQAPPPRAASQPVAIIPTRPSITPAAPAVKLNATQRVLGAIALAGKAKPAITSAQPVAAAPSQARKLTATEKCLAASRLKIKPATPRN